ncbi:MAG: hypothetical protein D6707_03515, partial [Bacteroidetes bacterium]
MLSHLNFKEHPVNKDYQVYWFTDYNKAVFFEEELIKQHISYEKHFEVEEQKYYFGVLKKDDSKVKKINELT